MKLGSILPAALLVLFVAGCSSPGLIEMRTVTTARAVLEGQVHLTTARALAAAVRLEDGRVLICGGTWNNQIGGVLKTAEIYDPAAGIFARTGDMTVPREGQTATLLKDGRVLVVGGISNIGYRSQLDSAEIYDPKTGAFTPTGSMSVPREGHTATLLPSGKVLIAGGSSNGIQTLSSAEIYDPTTGQFGSTGHMTMPRVAHTATLLRDGLVLIAGGGRANRPGGYQALDTAELYDPATGRFTATGRMVQERVGASATLLHDGRVLIAGGRSGRVLGGRQGIYGRMPSLTGLASAELYNPLTHTFTRTGPLHRVHYLQTATLLPNGSVLIAGGYNLYPPVVGGIEDAEVYIPESGQFFEVGPMETPRLLQTATLLPTGEVMMAGGIDRRGNPVASVEFYRPHRRVFVARPQLAGEPGQLLPPIHSVKP